VIQAHGSAFADTETGHQDGVHLDPALADVQGVGDAGGGVGLADIFGGPVRRAANRRPFTQIVKGILRRWCDRMERLLACP